MVINSLSVHSWGSFIINIEKKNIENLDRFKEIEVFFDDEIKNEICRDFYALDIDLKLGNILFQTSSVQIKGTYSEYL